MYCSYLLCLSLCIGTALAVLYNGEAPNHNVEPISGGLQHQQTQQQQQHTQQHQHQQTLPGYHYSVPTSTTPQTVSAISQQAFAGYRYNTPVAPTTTTTTTTTVRPPVTAAPTQAPTAGYFYSPPAAASYNQHTFYPPYYQQTHHIPALAISSDANAQQQLPLNGAPTYFVPQSDAGNVSDKRHGGMTNFFVPRDVREKEEVPQATQLAQHPGRETHGGEAAVAAYIYSHPASGAGLAAEPLTTYQRAFHEFADYLIWQRAQAKEREQQQQLPRIVTPAVQNSHATTLPHATQGVAPELNYSDAQKQFSFTVSGSSAPLEPQQSAGSSFPTQSYPLSTAVPPRNVYPEYAANFVDQTQAQPPVQRRPTASGALLTGERYISPNSVVEYLEMPSESWELPSYTNMDAVAPASNSVQYLYERDNRLVQTTPHILSGEMKRPQEEKGTQVQQERTESAQRYAPALQQQQLQQYTPTGQSQSKITQTGATQLAQIPQWPQNLALQAQQRLPLQQLATQHQQEQQRPLYSRVVAPLMPTAQLPAQTMAQSSRHTAGGYAAQGTLADQQQEQQQAKQQFYSQAQQQRTEQQLLAAAASSGYPQSTQLAAQSTQPSLTGSGSGSGSNSNSNSYFQSVANAFRRPHSSYGVPSENSNTVGYSYQRPVGQ